MTRDTWQPPLQAKRLCSRCSALAAAAPFVLAEAHAAPETKLLLLASYALSSALYGIVLR